MESVRYFRLDKTRRRFGFTIIEAIITIFIIASGFLILFNVFILSMRSATASRNRMVAELLADSTLEEIRAHKYGTSQPDSWTKPYVVKSIIQGKQNNVAFNRTITCANGSYFGTVPGDYDKITIIITWVEGTGRGSSGVTKKYKEAAWVRRAVE